MGKIAKSLKAETVEFLGYELTFHKLDNGKKVIEAESLEGFMKYLQEEQPPMTQEDIQTISQYLEEL